MAGSADVIATNGTSFNVGDTLVVTFTFASPVNYTGTLHIGNTDVPYSYQDENPIKSAEPSTGLGDSNPYEYVLTQTGTYDVYYTNHSYLLDSNRITITVIGEDGLSNNTIIQNLVNKLKSVFVLKNDIKDNLSSTDADKPLSAKQGKVLNEKIIGTNTFYGTTSTTASTQVKQVTVADTQFTLAEGTLLVLKSTTAQTYNASSTNPMKLCVNNGTEVPVQYINGNYSTRYMWSANEIVELLYDGTNWILLDNGLATTTYYGATKLNNTVTSTSTSLSATANSVKTAYDKGVEAYSLAEGKQDMLVSGTNIKTVNNESLLGTGNITVQGGTDVTVDSELSSSSTNPVRNSVITNALNNKSDSSHTHSNYNKATYSQTVSSSTSGAYEIGRITIDGASTILYGKDTDTVYTHPTYSIYNSTENPNGALYKISTNTLGHIIGMSEVTSTDIADLGVEITDTIYTHPTYTSKNSGLYKITVDGTGHISGTASVGANDLPTHTHTKSQITDFPTIPTKTSDLTNDSGFLTSHQSLSNYVQKSSTSGLLKNDGTVDSSSYLTTGVASSTYVAKETGKGLFSGSYNDLANKPSIPSKTSDLTNDSGFLTSHQDITGKEDKSNKVASLSSSSTDTQYPSAKCVYDNLESLFEDTIDELIEYGESL